MKRCLVLLVAFHLQVVLCRTIISRSLQQLDDAVVQKLTSGYMSNADLATYLEGYAQRCSSIAKLSSFGHSSGGVPLLALEVTINPGVDTAKPQVKYVGNIHGDEPSGRQLLLLLAEKLCAEYQQAGTPSHLLVKTMRLTIIPTMNPDGFAVHRRENGNNVDLNRNFPDPVHNKGKDLRIPVGSEQAETRAMMNFTLANRFVASLAFHEGALVANYPFDGYEDGSMQIKRTPHGAPDNNTLVYLASTYARLHTTMHNSKEFPNGITNGAQWYPLYGGMQDWNYLAANGMEITLELNDDKWPSPERLAAMWVENQEALVQWPLKTVMAGLRGNVTNASSQPVVATIFIHGVVHNITSSKQHGDYYRPLSPGQYTVSVVSDGYQSSTATITIPEDGTGVVHNWVLQPVGGAVTTKEVTPKGSEAAPAAQATTQNDGAQSGQEQNQAGSGVGPGPVPTPSTASTSSPSWKREEGDWVILGNGKGNASGNPNSWLASSGWAMGAVIVGVPLTVTAIYLVWRKKAGGGGGGWGYTQLTTFPRPAGYQAKSRVGEL